MMQGKNSFESRMEQFGFDVTCNVDIRMMNALVDNPETRSMHTPNLERAVAERLLVSFRDEAIWQYHLRRVRGFLLWAADLSIAYVPHWHGGERIAGETRQARALLSELLNSYEPTFEAVVLSEHENGDELFRISSTCVREDVHDADAVALSVC